MLAPAALLVAALGACSNLYAGSSPASRGDVQIRDVDIVQASYQATERLVGSARQVLDKDKPILVASLVNTANLQQSSDLGRIVSEQVSSRLTQLGYDTREMRLRGAFLIREGTGELVLSRTVKDISQKQNAQAVIAGVYAVAKTNVYLTLRLVRADDGMILAAYDYTLPLGPDASALLGPFETTDY